MKAEVISVAERATENPSMAVEQAEAANSVGQKATKRKHSPPSLYQVMNYSEALEGIFSEAIDWSEGASSTFEQGPLRHPLF